LQILSDDLKWHFFPLNSRYTFTKPFNNLTHSLLILFNSIFLAKGFHHDIYIYAYNVSYYVYLLHHSLHLIPFLEKFHQISLFSFHMCIQNTFTIFALVHPLHLPFSLPLVPCPGQNLLYPPILHFI
jgi:hypothetical protein